VEYRRGRERRGLWERENPGAGNRKVREIMCNRTGNPEGIYKKVQGTV